jgi:cytochrome c oxidase cbb3-type subunit 1
LRPENFLSTRSAFDFGFCPYAKHGKAAESAWKALTQVSRVAMTLAFYILAADLTYKNPKPWNLRMSTAISPTAYNYKVVRQFAIMTVVWGILGMGLGSSSPRNWYGRS